MKHKWINVFDKEQEVCALEYVPFNNNKSLTEQQKSDYARGKVLVKYGTYNFDEIAISYEPIIYTRFGTTLYLDNTFNLVDAIQQVESGVIRQHKIYKGHDL